MWRISQWRSIQGYTWHVDRTPSPPGGTPQPPRDDTLMSWPIATTAAKNGGKNPSQLLHSPAHWSIVYFVIRELSFFDCKNTRKAAFRTTFIAFEGTQSSHVKWYIMITSETRLGTPETIFMHPTTTTPSTKSISFSSSFHSWPHHNLKVWVLKVRSGFWKFVVRLPCCTTPKKCQRLHPHRTLALNPRAKYWDAIRLWELILGVSFT